MQDPPPLEPAEAQVNEERPQSWSGLMAAIQNEPIDPVQFGKDVFEETQGDPKKYQCILNGLSGKPFRLDLPSLYKRRQAILAQSKDPNDPLVQMFDFNMGVMLKMDMDRRMFNNVANVANASIFKQIIRQRIIPERYKFNPRRMKELICFTPIDVEEYQTADSMNVINWVCGTFLNDTNMKSEDVIKHITQKTLLSCVKAQYLTLMSINPSPRPGRRVIKPEFYLFLKRILYQSFGLPYGKYVPMPTKELVSGLPANEDPMERAAAVLIIKFSTETLAKFCDDIAPNDRSSRNFAENSDDEIVTIGDGLKRNGHKPYKRRKRRSSSYDD